MKHNLRDGYLTSEGVANVNLTLGMAVAPVYPDVAYQFRVRLVNRIGVSDPGPTAPGQDEELQKKCLLKAQPPTVRPDGLKVYGSTPNTLTAAWEVCQISSPLNLNRQFVAQVFI